MAIDLGPATFGTVTIVCPLCHRDATFPITSSPLPSGEAGARLTLDMHAVAAHLLTHGPHDGEPLPIAA